MKKKTSLIIICLLFVFSLCSCGDNGMDKKELENLEKYVTKDVSEYEASSLKTFSGSVYAYASKPCEWFIIEDHEDRYGFIILDSTKIKNCDGKVLKHQMFNVGPNDLVELKLDMQFGSISEEYDDIRAWFIIKELKIVDTLEY